MTIHCDRTRSDQNIAAEIGELGAHQLEWIDAEEIAGCDAQELESAPLHKVSNGNSEVVGVRYCGGGSGVEISEHLETARRMGDDESADGMARSGKCDEAGGGRAVFVGWPKVGIGRPERVTHGVHRVGIGAVLDELPELGRVAATVHSVEAIGGRGRRRSVSPCP
ncbi:unannotated protein [freshwater metagenome]|uniref:Unannotated protein n=1 Tax=freshwater metagenome TaxID=449393 RepID=A0A6J5YDD0_9ZZZZ